MSVSWNVDIDRVHTWHVGSIFNNNGGDVLIPMDQIDGMTDAEIGAAVRALAPQADYGVALNIADYYTSNNGARFNADDFYSNWEILERHAGKSRDVDRAIFMCEEAERLERRRLERQAAKRLVTVPGWIYIIKSAGFYKIGKTKDPKRRAGEFNVQLPHPFEFIAISQVNDMQTTETQLHEQFAHKRLNGEWFDLDADDLATITAGF